MRPVTQKNEATINFVTRHDTTTEEFYRSFMELLTVRYPQLAPEFFGGDPRCKMPFVGIEEGRRLWAMPGKLSGPDGESVWIGQSHLKRKSKIKNLITVNQPNEDKFGKSILGLLSMWVAPDKKLDWWGLFRDLTALFRPILGRMHIFVGPENGGFSFNSPQMRFWAGPNQPEMKEGLTNLGWANVFGDEYTGEVDEAALRAHGFVVEEFGGRKLFRVTESIFDILNDFPAFSRRRAELKGLFRSGLFRITEEPVMPSASAPE